MTSAQRTVVKIADLAVVQADAGEVVTHSLGSCIGLTVFDPVAKVGGLLHFMLPSPSQKAAASRQLELGPHAYGAAAVPALFRAAYAAGAKKERLVVCASGGAERFGGENDLRIGARNWAMLRKLLWKNGFTLAASDVGGDASRHMALSLETGHVSVTISGEVTLLFPERAS